MFNPISGYGHLDSWNKYLINIFLDSGWSVCAITPDVNGLLKGLREGIDSSLLKTYQYEYDPKKRGRHEPEKLNQGKPQKQSSLNLIQKIVNASDQSRFYKNKYGAHLKILIYCSLHFFKSYLIGNAKKYIKGIAIDNNSRNDFVEVENIINFLGIEPDLIFHTYLDNVNFSAVNALDYSMAPRKKWAGLRFSPSESDNVFYSVNSKVAGVLFLDEGWKKYFDERVRNMIFGTLPDITSNSLPLIQSSCAAEVLNKANGRKIIFLGGMIGWQKNIQKWFEVIKLSDPKKYFFLQVGEIATGKMSSRDLLEFYSAMYASVENLIIIPKFLEDESAFNELISVSDILFAVYRNFHDSSNMLTKASEFSKPIIVSNRYLMGKRIREYGIGVCVDEDDSKEIAAAIGSLPDASEFTKNFERYKCDFSMFKFKKTLTTFVESIS